MLIEIVPPHARLFFSGRKQKYAKKAISGVQISRGKSVAGDYERRRQNGDK